MHLEEEQKKLEVQLYKARKMQAIGTLAGRIAHDFNNIIGAIIVNAEMAIDDLPEDTRAKQDLELILESAYRAKNLVNQIIALTHSNHPGKGATSEAFPPRNDKRGIMREDVFSVSLPTGQERILFIDDEEGIVKCVPRVMEDLGYKVTAKMSGIAAFEIFSSQPDGFDLIITDLTMPHMTGLELSKKVMLIRSDIPVILCTGFSETVTPEEARAAGIREFLLKPIDKRNIARTVRRVLDG